MLAGLDSSSPQAALSLPIDALERELTLLAGHLNAANYRFLTLLAEFDRRAGHGGLGIHSCAHFQLSQCAQLRKPPLQPPRSMCRPALSS